MHYMVLRELVIPIFFSLFPIYVCDKNKIKLFILKKTMPKSQSTNSSKFIIQHQMLYLRHF